MKTRTLKIILTIMVFTVITILSPLQSFSKDIPAYSLDDLITMALEFSPQIREVEQEVEMAKTRLDEAKGWQYPQFDVLTLFGPAPEARGNQVFSTYKSDKIDGLGIFGQVNVDVVQPIYTFGKITEGKKAATHGIKVANSKVRQKATDVAIDIKKFYYGHIAALEGERLLNEISGYLQSAIDMTKKLLDEESEDVTELDLYKLEAFQGMLEKYKEGVKKNITLSKNAIRTFTGMQKGMEFALKDVKNTPVPVKVESLDFYSEKSKLLRPEFTQLREGLLAKRSLANMAKADLYPMVFLYGLFSYSEASDRDKVTNPWIFDFFRHKQGGVALGMKWHFDFGITKAKLNRARADRLKLERLRDYATIGIPMQVEKSYMELIEAKNTIEATKKAYQSARKWMIGAVMNYDMGIGEAGDAGDAIVAYGQIKQAYIESVYNFNMSYANVMQTSGMSVGEVTK